jgi:hypothetical protein
MKSNKRTMKNKEKGAALVEFALSVPLLFLFFSGVLEFGNILSQLTWVAQAGYTLAAVGAESPQNVAQSLLDSRLNQLIQAKNSERFGSRLEVSAVTPVGSDYYNNLSEVRTVTVSLKARIIPISSLSFAIPVDINVTAPQLVVSSNYNPDYSVFGAPQPQFFNCQFEQAGNAGSSTTCLPDCSRINNQIGEESCS